PPLSPWAGDRPCPKFQMMGAPSIMKRLLLGLALALATTTHAYGKRNHIFITGPFKSGPEVTKTCLECHERQTKAFMKTVHWTWSKKQSLNGRTIDYGKKNALDNFYGAFPSNWQ